MYLFESIMQSLGLMPHINDTIQTEILFSVASNDYFMPRYSLSLSLCKATFIIFGRGKLFQRQTISFWLFKWYQSAMNGKKTKQKQNTVKQITDSLIVQVEVI